MGAFSEAHTPLLLPSGSPLTGNLRPATAEAFVQTSYHQSMINLAKGRASGRQLTAEEAQQGISSLAKLGQRHLNHLARTPGTPRLRARTPDPHVTATLRQQKISALAHVSDEQHHHQHHHQHHQQPITGAEGGACDAEGGAASESPRQDKPLTALEFMAAMQRQRRTLSRPSSSLSIQDLTLPRPTSKGAHAPRFHKFPKAGQNLSASWSEPETGARTQVYTSPGAPRLQLGLHGAGARASAPTFANPASPHEQSNIWVNPLLSPTSPGPAAESAVAAPFAQKRLPLQLPHQSTSLPASTAHTPRTPGAAADAQQPASHLTQHQQHQQQHQQLPPQRVHAPLSHSPPRTQPIDAWQGVSPTGRRTVHAAGRDPAGQDGGPANGRPTDLPPPRTAPNAPHVEPHRGTVPLEHFTPTRGMMLSVFEELDQHGLGKLTYSAFEEAAVTVGLRADQAKRFFNRLENGSGVVTMEDWGNLAHEPQVLRFTRLFVQATRGMDGQMTDTREVGSMTAALQIAMNRLMLNRVGARVDPRRLMGVFKFMDKGKSGRLTAQEVADAFRGLGVTLSDDVLWEVQHKFGRGGDGIAYAQFVGHLFPD